MTWQLVNAATAAIDEYEHKRRRRERTWLTEENLSMLLFAINVIRILYK